MIGVMPNTDFGESEPGIRSGIGSLNRIEHVPDADRVERFFQRRERVPQISQQLDLGVSRAGPILVATRWRLDAVEFRGKPKVRAGNMLNLLPEGAHFGRTKFWFLALEHAWRRSEVPFVFRHRFSGRADIVLLKFKSTHDC